MNLAWYVLVLLLGVVGVALQLTDFLSATSLKHRSVVLGARTHIGILLMAAALFLFVVLDIVFGAWTGAMFYWLGFTILYFILLILATLLWIRPRRIRSGLLDPAQHPLWGNPTKVAVQGARDNGEASGESPRHG